MGVRCPKYVTKQVTISSVWAIQVGTELVIRHVPDHIQILTRRWLILQRRPLQIKLPSVLKLATLFVANEQTTLFIESIVRYLFNVSWMHCSFDWKTYSMTSTDFESQQLTKSYILIKSGIKTQVHVDCQATPYLSVNLKRPFLMYFVSNKTYLWYITVSRWTNSHDKQWLLPNDHTQKFNLHKYYWHLI